MGRTNKVRLFSLSVQERKTPPQCPRDQHSSPRLEVMDRSKEGEKTKSDKSHKQKNLDNLNSAQVCKGLGLSHCKIWPLSGPSSAKALLMKVNKKIIVFSVKLLLLVHDEGRSCMNLLMNGNISKKSTQQYINDKVY